MPVGHFGSPAEAFVRPFRTFRSALTVADPYHGV